MEKWLSKVRLIRQAARELEELESYLDECVACQRVIDAIFLDEPPKRRSRRRTTATQVTE